MLSKPKMDSRNFSILEIIKSPVQAMFLGLTAITGLLFLPLSYFGVKNIIKWSGAAPSGYQYPMLSDL